MLPRRYHRDVSAISFRPTDELHQALRETAQQEGRSIQSLLDAAARDYLQRRQRSITAMARAARARHESTFEALADL